MATAVPAVAPNGGTSASMWASQSGPTRTSWAGKGSEPGSTIRGMTRGGSRRRGGRGGGRGGRASSARNDPAKTDNASGKPRPADQVQEKAPSDLPKSPVQPQSTESPSVPKASVPLKESTRPRPARRGSEQKAPQRKGPSLAVDPSATTASNTSSSPSVSPRTPSRRKRGNSKAHTTAPATAAPPIPRKASQENGIAKEPPPVKDLPPHMAPQKTVPFDIKHDIDALVERVRAVAMDRPHTPGSHLDWAGDEDDSLPDLDDWGVTSTTATSDPEGSVASVISPILHGTLKPLPTLNDIDIPTPSIRLHEVHEEARGEEHAGDETPRETVPTSNGSIHTPTGASAKGADTGSSAGPSSAASRSNNASSGPSPPSSPKAVDSAKDAASIHAPSALRSGSTYTPSKDSSPSPDRGLSASIHAMPSSTSTPNHLPSRPPRGIFQPSHGRAQTIGRYKPERHSDSDRPRRGDAFTHGRNHSTPPTGPASGHRPAHTRPVISVDAISRLAKTLGGGSPLPRREKEASTISPPKAD